MEVCSVATVSLNTLLTIITVGMDVYTAQIVGSGQVTFPRAVSLL